MTDAQPTPPVDDGGLGGVEWSAIVAHQLKTPLCALDARLSGAARVDPRSVRRDIRKMTRLIDQLQTLARCRDVVAGTPRPLGRMARAVCTDLAPLCLRRDQRITFRDFAGARRSLLDEDLAQEALRNVVENAIKYSGRGAPIDVVVLPRSEVCVLDRGPGVTGRDREGMFEPFRRGRAVRAVAGTGLGLHLVREVMRLHGGGVLHRDRLGGGSVFVLRFLAAEPDTAALPAGGAPPP